MAEVGKIQKEVTHDPLCSLWIGRLDNTSHMYSPFISPYFTSIFKCFYRIFLCSSFPKSGLTSDPGNKRAFSECCMDYSTVPFLTVRYIPLLKDCVFSPIF